MTTSRKSIDEAGPGEQTDKDLDVVSGHRVEAEHRNEKDDKHEDDDDEKLMVAHVIVILRASLEMIAIEYPPEGFVML